MIREVQHIQNREIKSGQEQPVHRMATPNQQNLESKNKEYAADFKHKDLTLPPAKKYAVGMSTESSRQFG